MGAASPSPAPDRKDPRVSIATPHHWVVLCGSMWLHLVISCCTMFINVPPCSTCFVQTCFYFLKKHVQPSWTFCEFPQDRRGKRDKKRKAKELSGRTEQDAKDHRLPVTLCVLDLTVKIKQVPIMNCTDEGSKGSTTRYCTSGHLVLPLPSMFFGLIWFNVERCCLDP